MSESSYRRAVEQQAAQAAAAQAASQTSEGGLPASTCTETATLSDARLAANRANAQHSTGPRTEEGKATVCLNAVKTGLTGRTVLLPFEEAAPYKALMTEYEKALQPVGVEERALVQSLVDCRWRLDRIPGLEMALLTLIRNEWIARDPKYNNPVTAILTEMEIRRKHEKEFRNLQIQEARLARRRQKEMAELFGLQHARKANEAEALAQAAQAYLLAAHRKESFDLLALGFEFSTQQLEAYLTTLTAARKQQLLHEALKGGSAASTCTKGAAEMPEAVA
jgi:hypothetical protein